MADLVKKIRTSSGDLQIDYNALANLPNYAASSSAGGAATSANKLNTNAGGTTQPVYFANGVPVAIGYTIAKSVPSDAKFTDTTYTLSSFGITATAAELNYCDGVTSNIQTQLNGKAASSHSHAAGDITSGTLAVGRGGTGVTANPSMLTNLASTTAASVFAASPRPGVTGTLPIANGGTGATTVAGVLTNLGNIGKVYSSTPSAVSVSAGASKNVATLTLPIGTYIVVANSQWSSDLPSVMYMHRLFGADSTKPYTTTRGFMTGGGGAQTTAIISLTAQTTITYQVYNGHNAAVSSEAISLTAVKIK